MLNLEIETSKKEFAEFERKCKIANDTDQITFTKKFGKFFEVYYNNQTDQYTSMFFINAIKNKALRIIDNDYTVITKIIHTNKIGKNFNINEIQSEQELMTLESNNYKLITNQNCFYIINGSFEVYELQLTKVSEDKKLFTYRIINTRNYSKL